MHTLLVIAAGVAMGSAFGLLGFLWGGGAAGLAAGIWAFIPTWLLVAGINMWIGVVRAGYPVVQELPITGVVFAVPVAVVLTIRWMAAG